ncbi:FUSC family protein [Planctomonas psychrotolerans]|uniref:FUSC family protein n=1 Tax=Planctomonas psychrotolerans TaxID=2528712 RepID=UPI001238F8D1|nr:aromatic acid exporter family protein [Planctomonas psychrotolerans]
MNRPGMVGRRIVRTIVDELRPAVAGSRLLLAAKTALAASVAWLLAHLLPAEVDQYSYYAPLGAVISMSATLVGSARTSLQTLSGLSIGILLAWGVVALDGPRYISISLVIALGVVIGGIRRFGAGGEYVTVAALFVLVIGGAEPGVYSFSYLLQMAVGVAVGLAVNAIVVPPLHGAAADRKLSSFRVTLAGYLDDMGSALVEQWPPEHAEWAGSAAGLAAVGSDVREAMQTAAESRRANLRARRHVRDVQAERRDLEVLENVSFHIRDISETLASAVWGSPFTVTVPRELAEPLSDSLRTAAELLRAWETGDDEAQRQSDAERALDVLLERLGEYQSAHSGVLTGVASVAFDIHRIVQGIVPRLSTGREPQDG